MRDTRTGSPIATFIRGNLLMSFTNYFVHVCVMLKPAVRDLIAVFSFLIISFLKRLIKLSDLLNFLTLKEVWSNTIQSMRLFMHARVVWLHEHIRPRVYTVPDSWHQFRLVCGHIYSYFTHTIFTIWLAVIKFCNIIVNLRDTFV